MKHINLLIFTYIFNNYYNFATYTVQYYTALHTYELYN